jgi:hypothetical protein
MLDKILYAVGNSDMPQLLLRSLLSLILYTGTQNPSTAEEMFLFWKKFTDLRTRPTVHPLLTYLLTHGAEPF